MVSCRNTEKNQTWVSEMIKFRKPHMILLCYKYIGLLSNLMAGCWFDCLNEDLFLSHFVVLGYK